MTIRMLFSSSFYTNNFLLFWFLIVCITLSHAYLYAEGHWSQHTKDEDREKGRVVFIQVFMSKNSSSSKDEIQPK